MQETGKPCPTTARGVRKINDTFLRMNLRYDRETIAYQRNLAIEQLSRYSEEIALVPKQKYLHEMEASKVIVSPFGWGEINIRDFECFCRNFIKIQVYLAFFSC